MVTVPAFTPVTSPAASAVAVATSLLLHVPPVVEEDKVVVAPTQTEVIPVIGSTTGNGFTETSIVAIPIHPNALTTEYEMTLVPEVIPATIPVEVSTVATVTSELLQIPAGVALASVVVLPIHTDAVPVIGATTGSACTVLAMVAKFAQPITSVKV